MVEKEAIHFTNTPINFKATKRVKRNATVRTKEEAEGVKVAS